MGLFDPLWIALLIVVGIAIVFTVFTPGPDKRCAVEFVFLFSPIQPLTFSHRASILTPIFCFSLSLNRVLIWTAAICVYLLCVSTIDFASLLAFFFFRYGTFAAENFANVLPACVQIFHHYLKQL
jgi:tryptophan-rich sensory protein